jgi:hypothetical protein
MGLFDEKTEGQKSRDTVPLSARYVNKIISYSITLYDYTGDEPRNVQFNEI